MLRFGMFSLQRCFEKRESPCIEWPHGNEHGYGTIVVNGKKWRMHRYVMFLANPKMFRKFPNINHKCDNKRCINTDHLYYGTQRDNMRDLKLKNLSVIERPGNTDIEKENKEKIKHRLKPFSKGNFAGWRELVKVIK